MMMEAPLHIHKGVQRSKSKKRSPNKTPLGYSQSYHSCHQPIKVPSSEAQRSTGAQRQVRTKIKDAEEGRTSPGSSQGCPRKSSDPWSRCDTHQDE